jgi:hypothetical protein
LRGEVRSQVAHVSFGQAGHHPGHDDFGADFQAELLKGTPEPPGEAGLTATAVAVRPTGCAHFRRQRRALAGSPPNAPPQPEPAAGRQAALLRKTPHLRSCEIVPHRSKARILAEPEGPTP